MAEYLIQDTTLTGIADAVRAKTGKTDSILVSDMASEIANISTGVELNFEVVGGTTQPANPTENMIWVNTDTEITSWAFASKEPETIANGMVWFNIGVQSAISFNALKENKIQLCPNFVKQYIDDTWVGKEYKIYQDNSWAKYSLYLYNNGDICESVTGGYSAIGKGWDSGSPNEKAPAVTYNSDNVYMIESERYSGIFHTVNKIDLTLYKTLYFDGLMKHSQPNIASADVYCSLCIWSDIGTYASDNIAASILSDNLDKLRTLDVSNLNGEYYIGFRLLSVYQNGGSTVTMRQMWLE